MNAAVKSLLYLLVAEISFGKPEMEWNWFHLSSFCPTDRFVFVIQSLLFLNVWTQLQVDEKPSNCCKIADVLDLHFQGRTVRNSLFTTAALKRQYSITSYAGKRLQVDEGR